MSSTGSTPKTTPRGDAAEELEKMRRRAAERKNELKNEEDMLRRERRNLMSAKKRAERGEADLLAKLERLERDLDVVNSENKRLASESEHKSSIIADLEAELAARPKGGGTNAEESTEADALRGEYEAAREQDLRNFRLILAEEREKLATLEAAWNGVLGGTHDAEIKCSTQRLSTGRTLTHITSATVRETGKGGTAAGSTPRRWDDMSVIDRMGLRGRMKSYQAPLASDKHMRHSTEGAVQAGGGNGGVISREAQRYTM